MLQYRLQPALSRLTVFVPRLREPYTEVTMRPFSLAGLRSSRAPSPARRRHGPGLPLAMVLIGAASAVAFVTLQQAPMPEELALASVELLFASPARLTP
jgi:hypothetical protein